MKKNPTLQMNSRFPLMPVRSTVWNVFLFWLCLLASVAAQAQGSSPLLWHYNHETKADSNYVLFAPESLTTTYLIRKSDGSVRKSWNTIHPPGMSVYLLPGLRLLHTENMGTNFFQYPGGGFAVYDSNSTYVWGNTIYTDSLKQTHDIFPMPNGNVLVDAWEFISNSRVKAAGRDTTQLSNGLWSGMIQEFQQDCDTCKTGHVVWQWRFWDHLQTDSNPDSIRAHPELLNVNFIGTPDGGNGSATPVSQLSLGDWIHMNAIAYHPGLNQIMISSRNLNEIYIIEHTDSATALTDTGGVYGHGGAFLYRWGNPAAYGMPGPQLLFGQHSPYWVDTTNLNDNRVMINNDGFLGTFSNGKYSITYGPTLVTQIRIPFHVKKKIHHREPNKPFGPASCDTIYMAQADTQSGTHQGSAQQLRNDNVLVCVAVPNGPPANSPAGTGALLYELDKAPAGTSSPRPVIWACRLNGSQKAFRCHQYGAAYVDGIVKTPRIPKH